jgi:hypothetical protein
MSNTRYHPTELFELENRIFDLEFPFNINKDDKISLFICEEIKRELYNNKGRMDGYRFWDEMHNQIIEKQNKRKL